MLESLLASVASALPYVSGLLAVLALIGVIVNFRQARRAPYFRMRRAAAVRGWRWVLVLLVSAGVFIASLRLPRVVPPSDVDALPPVPTSTQPPIPTATIPPPPALPSPTPTPPPPTATATPTPTSTPTESGVVPLPDATLEITAIATGISPSSLPISPGMEFPAGIQRVYYTFRYSNMTDGVLWTRTLLFNGAPIREESGAWEAGESGVGYYYFFSQDGWPPGQYEVRFTIGDRIADSAEYTITGE